MWVLWVYLGFLAGFMVKECYDNLFIKVLNVYLDRQEKVRKM